MLPDVALLNIFDFYLKGEYIEFIHELYETRREVWLTLAHVCRRWRNVLLESPRRLDLRVFCRASTPVRELPDIWPNFPIVVTVSAHVLPGDVQVANTIAALKHNNRVCAICLWDLPNSHSEQVLAAMQQPFPELKHLVLMFTGETALVYPDSFLGGSAQRLQSLILYHIPFPGLPSLLLSATHLVRLHLWRIPHSGYISSDVMVTTLSALTRLESLHIDFISPRSRPTQKSRRSQPTRVLFPVLTLFQFRGASEYLEDLVAWIDAPLLNSLSVDFFHKLIFDTPQLALFISHTSKSKVFHEAHVGSFYLSSCITLYSTSGAGNILLYIRSRQPDWQLLSLAQVCSSSFPHVLTPVERLYIESFQSLPPPPWQDETSQWLELLHLFTGAKDVYISPELTPRIGSALQEAVGERVTEVLPSLRTLFLEKIPSGSVPEAFGKFVAARQLAGHPISVSRWDGKRR